MPAMSIVRIDTKGAADTRPGTAGAGCRITRPSTVLAATDACETLAAAWCNRTSGTRPPAAAPVRALNRAERINSRFKQSFRLDMA